MLWIYWGYKQNSCWCLCQNHFSACIALVMTCITGLTWQFHLFRSCLHGQDTDLRWHLASDSMAGRLRIGPEMPPQSAARYLLEVYVVTRSRIRLYPCWRSLVASMICAFWYLQQAAKPRAMLSASSVTRNRLTKLSKGWVQSFTKIIKDFVN